MAIVIGPYSSSSLPTGINSTTGALSSLLITGNNNATPFTLTGGSITGSGTTSFASITGTWNTSGAPIASSISITDTASASGGRYFQVNGGAAGTAEKFAVLAGNLGIRFQDNHGWFSFGSAGFITVLNGTSICDYQLGSTANSSFTWYRGCITVQSAGDGAKIINILHDGTSQKLTWLTGSLVLTALPTSNAGLPSGALFTTAGAVMQVA